MKRKVLLFLMVAGFATLATAQNNSRYYAESAKDNFFISIGAGAQACVNPDNMDYGFGKVITPNFTISLGKLINPVWGVRLQAAGLKTTLFSKFNAPANGYNEYKNKKYAAVYADALFNVSNALAGYNPDRIFDLYAFAGPGLTISKPFLGVDQDKVKALVNGSVGLGGKFNVSKSVDINLEARGTVSQAPFGDVSSKVADGSVSLTAGISYFFGGKKFVKVVNEDLYNAANGDIRKYKELLEKEQADHNLTKEELERERNKKPEQVVEYRDVLVAGPRAIFFNIGSSKIDGRGKANIELAADIIKSNPDVKYVVKGYADKATGSARFNEKLSEKRAKAVYDALVGYGVSESQLEYQGLGGQPNMWNSAALTRVVVIEKAN